jgi:hypothetical protein
MENPSYKSKSYFSGKDLAKNSPIKRNLATRGHDFTDNSINKPNFDSLPLSKTQKEFS